MNREDEVIEHGYLIAQNERIEEYGRFDEEVEKRVFQQKQNIQIVNDIHDNHIVEIEGILMPGFVKAHGHDEPTLVGLQKETILTEWLNKVVNPFSKYLQQQRQYLQQVLRRDPFEIIFEKSRLDDLQFGITTVLAHQCNYNKYYIKEFVSANQKVGLRAIVAVGSQDRNYEHSILDTVEQAIQRLDEAFTLGDSLNTIIAGPDQDFSNSPEMLIALKKWSVEHEPHLLHIHSSEEAMNTLKFVQKYGQTPIEYFNSIGLLDGNTFVAHQVQCTQNDLEILSRTRTPVVNNPLANTVLMSGVVPYDKFSEHQIKYAISTDGSGSADNQNILSACKLAYYFAAKQDVHQSSFQMLQRITSIPASILKVNSGQIRVGSFADFNVFDLGNYFCEIDKIYDALLHGFVGNEILYTVCNGVVIINKKKFVNDNVQYQNVLDGINYIFKDFMAWLKEYSANQDCGV